MHIRWVAHAVGAVMSCACASLTHPVAPADAGASLPVQSVRLYETGVAYFERAGRLATGNDGISLPASQVDDALKTMVVLSDGARVRVSAIEFPSVLSQGLARVQAGLPAAPSERLSYATLLESLRGTRVELTRVDGVRLSGRLVEVSPIEPGSSRGSEPGPRDSATTETPEAEDDASGGDGTSAAQKPARQAPFAHYALTLLTDDGGVMRLNSARVRELRPRDATLAARLDSAVSTASERGAQSPRWLRVSATPGASVRIGYIAETPVWRATYRLLLAAPGSPATLQGWVLVHNDSDEPWRSVSLEIVNGKPDSFLFPLSAPRYLRRPLVTPPETMSTLPQLASKTVDQIWGDHDDTALSSDSESFGGVGLGLSSVGQGGGGQGFGSGVGSLAGRHAAASETDAIDVGNLAQTAQSQAVASGAEFSYRMSEPLTLDAHHSALVPFTRVSLIAERMTRFTWNDASGRSSVRLKNDSGQTLPGGPLSIYTATGLAGETTLERLVSSAETWLGYGADLDTESEPRALLADTHATKLVRFEAGQLVEHFVRHREQELHLANHGPTPRTLCVELPVVDNARVQGADRLLYDHALQSSLGVFVLEARSERTPVLSFDEGLKRALPLAQLGPEQLAELAAAKDLDAATKATLLEAAALAARQQEPRQKQQRIRESLERLESDRQRLDHTLEQLKGTSGNGAEPLVRRLVELEARRSRLENDRKALADTEAANLPALSAILERLNARPARGARH